MMVPMTPDQRSDRCAARQHGLLTSVDALASGLSRAQIEHRVRTRRWVVVARGLYRVTSAPVTPHQVLMAAILAGPAQTVASHLSAAWLFGLVACPSLHHVTVPVGSSARRLTARVHRSTLAAHERAHLLVVPVTSPTRTVVDSASLLAAEPLGDLIDAAIVGGLTTAAKLDAAAGGRTGSPRLASALKPWTDPIRPGSPAEVRLMRRLADWGFPPPVSQYVVRDEAGRFLARVDLAWPDRKVAAEYDGAGSHTPRQLDHDEDRRARIEALGWRVEDVDRTDLRAGSGSLRHRLAAALSLPRAA